MRRLLYVAMTRAAPAAGARLAGDGRRAAAPSPFYEEAREALDGEEHLFDEELFGPGEDLHSTFRMMRDELLDTVSRVGGRLGEMRLDTHLDVSHAVARYLELLKLAALIERSKEGQPLDGGDRRDEPAAAPVGHAPSSARSTSTSALDDYLRDTGARPEAARRGAGRAAPRPRSTPFIPRRGDGLMLSASDIETYRICPLKYKFARVFSHPAGADDQPALRDRGAPGARALPPERRRHARQPDVAVRGVVAARRLRRVERRPPVPRAGD